MVPVVEASVLAVETVTEGTRFPYTLVSYTVPPLKPFALLLSSTGAVYGVEVCCVGSVAIVEGWFQCACGRELIENWGFNVHPTVRSEQINILSETLQTTGLGIFEAELHAHSLWDELRDYFGPVIS